MKFKPVHIVIAVALVAAFLYLRFTKTTPVKVTTIDTDTTVSGDMVLKAGEKILLNNNAKLTITGSLSGQGEIDCKGGSASVTVQGATNFDGTLKCIRNAEIASEDTAQGITIITQGSVTFGANARVISNGQVQVVGSAGALLTTQEQIDALYDETAKDTGSGPRIGPFVSGSATVSRAVLALPPMTLASAADGQRPYFIKTAQAQTPRDDQGNPIDNVVIGGNWYVGDGGNPPPGVDIPTPPKKVKKIILNFDFGANGNVTFKDFYLAGPNGRDGDSDTGTSCTARGSKGEDAFRMRVQAGTININNFTLQMGNGGSGGEAETIKDCDPGRATGGDGGEAGNFKMMASGGITIQSFRIIPGVGGSGGDATGQGRDGKNGCPGDKGGDAIATGGRGGDNKKELSVTGSVSGVANVTIDTVIGGGGGKANANPGKGGNGVGCGCNGGKGGNGTSTGGDGGSASLKVVGAAGSAEGGNGGNADAHGATGGNGGQCDSKGPGGNGGKGGDAKSTEGKGGKGTTSDGDQGTITDETGGNGGNGGDGCNEGSGGAGGNGKPNGTDGKPGKNLCVETKNTNNITTNTNLNVNTNTNSNTNANVNTNSNTNANVNTNANQKVTIQVIQYNGKYLPVSQLIVESEQGCDGGKAHWHAASGAVKATDGTVVADPGPQCGYGKLTDKPIMQVQVDAGYQVEIRGMDY